MRTMMLMCCFALVGAASLSAQSGNAATPGNAVTPPPVSAQQRLQDAQQALAAAPETAGPRHGHTSQSQLTQDFSALVASYGARQPGDGAWRLTFADVERDVVILIGGGGPPLEPSPKPIRRLRTELLESSDAADQLTAFRTDLELFYDAATTGLRETN
jgi:hypothetical protein